MAITGVRAITYRTEQVDAARVFYEHFGLPPAPAAAGCAAFELPDGSRVLLQPPSQCGFGTEVAVETTWGVDTEEALQRLVDDLSRDHAVRRDADGTCRFVTDFGLPMALARFSRTPVLYAPDPVNAPGRVQRLNQWRKWRARARPKTINHVVYAVDDYRHAWDFFRRRLGFRLSDHSRGLGIFLRADGAPEHHSLFLLNCHYHRPGRQAFAHACFGVEDLDELMAGANHLARNGHSSKLGLGRHRIASALFYYVDCPAGGEAEYGADTDYLDDGWVPREWDPKFGYVKWCTSLPPFLQEEAAWDVRFLASEDDVRIPDLAAYRKERA
jgi:catechol 2,3-dioxygenase-like lactoylglutathione lyase family enzyme